MHFFLSSDCSLLDVDGINNTGALLRIVDSLLQTYEASAVLSDNGMYVSFPTFMHYCHDVRCIYNVLC